MKRRNQANECSVLGCRNRRAFSELCFSCLEKLPAGMKDALHDTFARRHADGVAYVRAVGEAKKYFAALAVPSQAKPAPDHSRILGEKPE